MESVSEVHVFFEVGSEEQALQGNEESEQRPSLIGWYRILRAHYQWPLFEAIRFALWLSR